MKKLTFITASIGAVLFYLIAYAASPPVGGSTAAYRPKSFRNISTVAMSATQNAHFNIYSTNRQAEINGKATTAQGDKADSALQPTGNGSQLTGITASQVANPVFTSISTCSGNKTISAANGPMQYMRLTGNCTINSWTQPSSGVLKLLLRITNTGSYTMTYSGGSLWPGGSKPTMTSGAGKIDWLACILDGTSVSCAATQDFQ